MLPTIICDMLLTLAPLWYDVVQGPEPNPPTLDSIILEYWGPNTDQGGCVHCSWHLFTGQQSSKRISDDDVQVITTLVLTFEL